MTHHLEDRGTPFRFLLPGLADSKAGYIINRVNDSLLIEGIGADNGLYFVKKGNTITQFDTKLAADSAMDAAGSKEFREGYAAAASPKSVSPESNPYWNTKKYSEQQFEDWDAGYNSYTGKDQGLLVHGVEPRGKDPHENPYVEYDIPDTRSGKDSKEEGTLGEAWVGGKKQKVWIPSKETAEKAAG